MFPIPGCLSGNMDRRETAFRSPLTTVIVGPDKLLRKFCTESNDSFLAELFFYKKRQSVNFAGFFPALTHSIFRVVADLIPNGRMNLVVFGGGSLGVVFLICLRK